MPNNILLVDCCSNFFEMDLRESNNPRALTKFRGKFQEAGAVNKNKRMYPWDVLDESVKRLQEAIKGRQLVGELDHPADSIIHLTNASHMITKLWWDGNVLMGEGEILSTPSGRVLKALIEDGFKVGISSRGIGNGSVNEDGILVIGESYKLITFDAVADPSTFEAFQSKYVPTSKKEDVYHGPVHDGNVWATKNVKKNNSASSKNESVGIDRINPNALIAYLGGIVKSKSEQIKSRLG